MEMKEKGWKKKAYGVCWEGTHHLQYGDLQDVCRGSSLESTQTHSR